MPHSQDFTQFLFISGGQDRRMSWRMQKMMVLNGTEKRAAAERVEFQDNFIGLGLQLQRQ